MKKLFSIVVMSLCAVSVWAQTYEYDADYDQARKFSGGKLTNMLFSTKIDPHWTPKGDRFWYTYKTSQGVNWYIVNPSAKSKRPLFDREAVAAELSLITHDPIVADHLPISGLEAKEDGTGSQGSPRRTDTPVRSPHGTTGVSPVGLHIR